MIASHPACDKTANIKVSDMLDRQLVVAAADLDPFLFYPLPFLLQLFHPLLILSTDALMLPGQQCPAHNKALFTQKTITLANSSYSVTSEGAASHRAEHIWGPGKPEHCMQGVDVCRYKFSRPCHPVSEDIV